MQDPNYDDPSYKGSMGSWNFVPYESEWKYYDQGNLDNTSTCLPIHTCTPTHPPATGDRRPATMTARKYWDGLPQLEGAVRWKARMCT